MTFKALWYGCWFSHSPETHWTGQVLTCQRCGEGIPILATKAPKGEKHQADHVRGVPKMKAKPVRAGNVVEFERVSER